MQRSNDWRSGLLRAYRHSRQGSQIDEDREYRLGAHLQRPARQKLLGIVTDRDLALQVVAENRDASSTKVQDVMTREPLTCRADDDLQTALDAMEKHQVRRIPAHR